MSLYLNIYRYIDIYTYIIRGARLAEEGGEAGRRVEGDRLGGDINWERKGGIIEGKAPTYSI